MKRCRIYVFSGTGNTRMCADLLKSELEKRSVSAELIPFETGYERAQKAGDMIVCYPVHAFNTPENVLRFVKGFPVGAGGVYFLKTSGEPLSLNDNSSAPMIRILEKKGYTILGEFHFVMPYNILFRHSDEMASRMLQTARRRMPRAARYVAASKPRRKRIGLGAKAMSGLCRIEHFGVRLNGRLYKVNTNRCVKCMRCVKECPVQNIRYKNGRFSFGMECVGCGRCYFQCPVDAYTFGFLNPMRVNGAYDFTRDPSKAVIGKYCHDAYERYFRQDERRTAK